MSEEPGERRVSWVELYFDLIFVFAVGETTHITVTDPNWAGFGCALGLFVLLWWTWIGFVVLCNRHHEDRIPQRLFVLAGTLPSAVAAAFALLTMAAGVSLALSGQAPPAAAWFITGGLAAYLMGSRALVGGGRVRSGPLLRAAVVAVTVCLALFRPAISTTGVVLVTAAWACAIAAYVT